MSNFDEPGWLFAYAQYGLTLKGIKQNTDTAVRYAQRLKFAFNKLYRAVAFDIDGTLTEQGSPDISPELIAVVTSLLRRGVPILMVTGRGRGTTLEAATKIRQDSSLSDWYMRRLRCSYYEGAFYLRTDPDRPSEFLRNITRIAPLDHYATHCLRKTLADVKESIEKKIPSVEVFLLPDSGEKTHLRCVADDDQSARAAFRLIKRRVKDIQIAGRRLNVSMGQWANNHSIALTTCTKKDALRYFASDIGVHEDQILQSWGSRPLGWKRLPHFRASRGFFGK